MGKERLMFEGSIFRAIEEIQRNGKTRCQVQGGNGNYSNEIHSIQNRHTPGIVKHYREADFKNDIPPENLSKLSRLIDKFRELTEQLDPLKPVSATEIKGIDDILQQIHSTLEGL